MLPKRWDSVIEKHGDYIEGLWTDNLKEIKVLVKKYVWLRPHGRNENLYGDRKQWF